MQSLCVGLQSPVGENRDTALAVWWFGIFEPMMVMKRFLLGVSPRPPVTLKHITYNIFFVFSGANSVI